MVLSRINLCLRSNEQNRTIEFRELAWEGFNERLTAKNMLRPSLVY